MRWFCHDDDDDDDGYGPAWGQADKRTDGQTVLVIGFRFALWLRNLNKIHELPTKFQRSLKYE